MFPSQIDGKVVQTLEQVLDVFDPVPKTGKPEKNDIKIQPEKLRISVMMVQL